MEKFLLLREKTNTLFLFVLTSELLGVPEEVRGRARGHGKTLSNWVLWSFVSSRPEALERAAGAGGCEGQTGRAERAATVMTQWPHLSSTPT